MYGYGRKQGLQDADAADLTQNVMRKVCGAVGRLEYDPQRGSFRGWLLTVVRNELCTLVALRRRQEQASGDSSVQRLLLNQAAPENGEAQAWELQYERRLFDWAAEEVQREVEATTWQAFWRTSIEGESAKQAAEALGMSVAAVYMAKSRIVARLKQCIQLAEATDPIGEE